MAEAGVRADVLGLWSSKSKQCAAKRHPSPARGHRSSSRRSEWACIHRTTVCAVTTQPRSIHRQPPTPSARPAVPLICRFKHGVFMNYGAASKSTPSHVDGFAISLWQTPTIRAPTPVIPHRSTKAFFRTANRKVVTAPGVIIAFVFGYLIVFSCACSVPSTRFRTFLGTF